MKACTGRSRPRAAGDPHELLLRGHVGVVVREGAGAAVPAAARGVVEHPGRVPPALPMPPRPRLTPRLPAPLLLLRPHRRRPSDPSRRRPPAPRTHGPLAAAARRLAPPAPLRQRRGAGAQLQQQLRGSGRQAPGSGAEVAAGAPFLSPASRLARRLPPPAGGAGATSGHGSPRNPAASAARAAPGPCSRGAPRGRTAAAATARCRLLLPCQHHEVEAGRLARAQPPAAASGAMAGPPPRPCAPLPCQRRCCLPLRRELRRLRLLLRLPRARLLGAHPGRVRIEGGARQRGPWGRAREAAARRGRLASSRSSGMSGTRPAWSMDLRTAGGGGRVGHALVHPAHSGDPRLPGSVLEPRGLSGGLCSGDGPGAA